MSGREYPKILSLLDFVGIRPTDTDIELVAGVWNKLGIYTVPNGMKLAVGARRDGYVYLRLDCDGTGQVHGRARIKVSNPTEDRKIPVLEFNTRACASASSKQGNPFVPISMPWAQANSKLILEFFPDTDFSGWTNTLDCDDANTLMYLKCTYRLT